MNRRILPLLTLLISFAALPLLAGGEWYDHYELGKNACDAGDFGSCESHMKKAVAEKPGSEKGARTYGMGFTDYTPYYYLGLVANNRGDNVKASQYFEKEANFGVIYKTPNNGSFVQLRKMLANMAAAAPPPDDSAKKEAERLAAQKAEGERLKKENEEAAAKLEEERKKLAQQQADAAKNQQANNAKPPAIPTARPVTPTIAPPPAVVVAVAPKDNSAEAMQEVGRRAVSMILKGDLGNACASLEQKAVKPHFENSPGYYLLLSYAYYLRSFNQPERKQEFEGKAKEYVQTASRLNSSVAPDDKFFSPKFVTFYKNNI